MTLHGHLICRQNSLCRIIFRFYMSWFDHVLYVCCWRKSIKMNGWLFAEDIREGMQKCSAVVPSQRWNLNNTSLSPLSNPFITVTMICIAEDLQFTWFKVATTRSNISSQRFQHFSRSHQVPSMHIEWNSLYLSLYLYQVQRNIVCHT